MLVVLLLPLIRSIDAKLYADQRDCDLFRERAMEKKATTTKNDQTEEKRRQQQ